MLCAKSLQRAFGATRQCCREGWSVGCGTHGALEATLPRRGACLRQGRSGTPGACPPLPSRLESSLQSSLFPVESFFSRVFSRVFYQSSLQSSVESPCVAPCAEPSCVRFRLTTCDECGACLLLCRPLGRQVGVAHAAPGVAGERRRTRSARARRLAAELAVRPRALGRSRVRKVWFRTRCVPRTFVPAHVRLRGRR
jgi:hypothetical protein